MVWETEPRYVVGILVLRVARALIPLAVLWVGKLIVDEVVRAIGVVGAGRELCVEAGPPCISRRGQDQAKSVRF